MPVPIADVPARALEVVPNLDTWFSAAASTLPPAPRAALRRIPDRERRRLAIAHYLRRRHEIDSLWAWTAQEHRAYQATEPYRVAMRDLRRVRRAFTARNPGFVLVTDTLARSLQTQIRLWNRERSVRVAARELTDSLRAWVQENPVTGQLDRPALRRFVDHLLGYTPSHVPTVAVPGLSRHGRLQAFDFAVLRRGEVVAGTTSTTVDSVWDRGGWTDRVREAVSAGGETFVGPLADPWEPWHYERRP
jgi:hypothetical protein